MPGQDAAETPARRSTADDILQRLSADILECRFLPGEVLRPSTLRRRYLCGPGLLHVALAQAMREGLVVAGAGGVRVAPASRAQLAELVEACILIEREALRLSLKLGGATWRDALAEAHQHLEEAPRQPGDGRAWAEWRTRHGAFHDALVGACDSATLLDIRARLLARSHRYVMLAWRLCPDGAGMAGSHRPILESALAHDVRRTWTLVEAEIRQVGRTVLEAAAQVLPER